MWVAIEQIGNPQHGIPSVAYIEEVEWNLRVSTTHPSWLPKVLYKIRVRLK
jgi:hypothetical protein